MVRPAYIKEGKSIRRNTFFFISLFLLGEGGMFEEEIEVSSD